MVFLLINLYFSSYFLKNSFICLTKSVHMYISFCCFFSSNSQNQNPDNIPIHRSNHKIQTRKLSCVIDTYLFSFLFLVCIGRLILVIKDKFLRNKIGLINGSMTLFMIDKHYKVIWYSAYCNETNNCHFTNLSLQIIRLLLPLSITGIKACADANQIRII